MKKLTVIGTGTAGVVAAAHFAKHTNFEIDLVHDPKIKAQAVGEGVNSGIAGVFYENFKMEHTDLPEVDGSLKISIYKENWSDQPPFHHTFAAPQVAWHINANKLQSFIIKRLGDRVNLVEQSVVDHSELDSDFVMDCSGFPKNFDDFIMSDYIPVNSVHVTQCFWDGPEFLYTLAIARPYGWVFGIPLQNRCSIGYMYNNNINTLEEVKEDVKEIFKQFNLTPSETTNSFSFKNFYRKNNSTGRVCYNGNASFFLEPLEATSIGFMNQINRRSFDIWCNGHNVEQTNNLYIDDIEEIQNMIVMHYLNGSKFKTKFWEFAQDCSERLMRKAVHNKKFEVIYELSKNKPLKDVNVSGVHTDFLMNTYYGIWGIPSYTQNLNGLGLYDKLDSLFEEKNRGVQQATKL